MLYIILSTCVVWENTYWSKAAINFANQVSKFVFYSKFPPQTFKKIAVCVYMTYYLISLLHSVCIWIYRPLTINSAPPRGLRPTGWQAQGRTGLWLMTERKAWATSAGLPLFLSSWPSHFPPETLHWDLFTKNIFCVNVDKLVMTFHSGNIVFSCQNMYCTLNRDLNNWEKSHFNSRCTRSLHLLRCSSLSQVVIHGCLPHTSLYLCNICVCVHSKSHSDVSDSVTLWIVAHQSPLSMGFSRQE